MSYLDRQHWRARGATLGCALVVAALALMPGVISARQATPASTGPDTSECTADPRPFPIWDGTPAVGITVPPVTTDGPFVPPEGSDADDGTVTGVTATVQEAIACTNAGETRRLLSLFSDNRVSAFFAGRAAPAPAEIESLLSEVTTPVPDESRLVLVSIGDVQLLPNGRAGAVIETRSGDTTFIDFVWFVEDNGRWLIDKSVAIDSSTQVGATPTA